MSYWQGKPPLKSYKQFKDAGWDFLIARIGYADNGIKYPDSTFESNYRKSNAAKLRIGAYFYSNARNGAEGRAEAKYCLQLLEGKALSMPVFIDMEDNATSGTAGKADLAAACRAFCEEIESAGYMAGVYASASWFSGKIGSLGDLSKWVAQYNSVVTYNGSYDMWQYSGSAKVEGFSGVRDVNRCYTAYDDNFLIMPKVNLLIRKGSRLISPRVGTLSKNGIYRITRTAGKGTRGYIPGTGWVTITTKFVRVINFTDTVRIRTKAGLIYRESPLLSSKKKGTLKKGAVYRISRISQNGRRGYINGFGWITVTEETVKFL